MIYKFDSWFWQRYRETCILLYFWLEYKLYNILQTDFSTIFQIFVCKHFLTLISFQTKICCLIYLQKATAIPVQEYTL